MDADRWEDGEKVERWIAKRDKGKESEEKPKSERHWKMISSCADSGPDHWAIRFTRIYSTALRSWTGKNVASGEKAIKMHAGESKWAKFESKPA